MSAFALEIMNHDSFLWLDGCTLKEYKHTIQIHTDRCCEHISNPFLKKVTDVA